MNTHRVNNTALENKLKFLEYMEEKKIVILIPRDQPDDSLHSFLSNVIPLATIITGDFSETELKINQCNPDIIVLNPISRDETLSESIKQIKAISSAKDIPLVVFTRPEDKELRLKALESGADEFLMYPPDKAEIQARLRSLLTFVGHKKGRGIWNENLELEVDKRTETLKQALEKIKVASLDTIFRLSRAAEYKDTDTGAHIERMSHYSTAIARQMNLQEEFIENILYAAPMHDIGKIGIPDRVLQKPGKLDPEEWEIMKKHTLIGAEILKDSKVEFMKLAEEIALAHHEKWDGTGYPRKLKGKEIPLGARIVALADVFDALTSERPYKQPMELEKSCSIIIEGRGTHFDPDVVDAFLAIKEEIAASLNWWKFMASDSDGENLF